MSGSEIHHAGHLSKKGATFGRWTRRYVVLQGSSLLWFKDENATSAKSLINLNGRSIDDIDTEGLSFTLSRTRGDPKQYELKSDSVDELIDDASERYGMERVVPEGYSSDSDKHDPKEYGFVLFRYQPLSSHMDLRFQTDVEDFRQISNN